MTKEDVLQKAKDYCDEKGYNVETLTDDFKDKFADFFAKKNPDADINDENIIADLHFNLNTAFSAASKGITSKQQAYDAMVEEKDRQIEELNKQVSNANKKPKQNAQQTQPTISDEIQAKLDRLEQFEKEARIRDKAKEVLELAKKNVRKDLHKSLENYAADFAVTVDETSEEQAKKLTERFQAIFRDSIGSIKPLAPKQTTKQDNDYLAELPKVKV